MEIGDFLLAKIFEAPSKNNEQMANRRMEICGLKILAERWRKYQIMQT